ncbi:MAG: hypothetical protein GY819_13065 [Planctomycetaceae bacterium]|nr:hypothetical protein [Planctomycetaceae bacterium]
MSHYFKRLAARSRINQVGGVQGEAPARVATTAIRGIDRTVNPGAGVNAEIHQEAVTVSGPTIPTVGNSAVSEHLESMPGVTGMTQPGVDKVKRGSFDATGSRAQEASVAKTVSTDRKLVTSPGQVSNPQEVEAVTVRKGLHGDQHQGRSLTGASSLAADVRPVANETANDAQVRPVPFESDMNPTSVAAVIVRDSARAGTTAAGSKGDANPANAATLRGPREQPHNAPLASKGIEIKIGKIDLEIHQVNTSIKPVPSQSRARQKASESIVPRNNLSRFYIRGGYD